MQEMSVFWLRAATALYAIGLLHTIYSVLRRHVQVSSGIIATFALAVVLHFVSIVETAKALGHFPANNFYESISLCGLLTALLFLYVYWRYQFQSLSIALFPLVFFMTLIGSMQFPVGGWTTRTTRDAWLIVHVILVMVGYAAMLLTAIASVFYLMQEKQLKTKRRGGLFERLPPLGTLDNLISISMGTGFVLITLGLVTGSTWAFVESGTRWLADPKIVISLLTWAFYLLMVFLRLTAGWRGRKAAVMAIALLGCSAMTWVAHVGLRTMLLQ